jgi:transcriptional regulator with XRE-family HTH domain
MITKADLTIQNELIGTCLRQIRENRNYTQEKIAKILKVTKFTVSQIETGTRNPTSELLQEIINKLELSPYELSNLKKAYYENKDSDTPEELKLISSIDKEPSLQEKCDSIHVVADIPLEMNGINRNNVFLMMLIKSFKKIIDLQHNVKYIYWTSSSTETEVNNFLLFIKENEIPIDFIKKTFVVVFAPEELLLFSHGIYVENGNTYGKLVIDYKNGSKLVSLADKTVAKIYRFLQGKYDSLNIPNRSNRPDIERYRVFIPDDNCKLVEVKDNESVEPIN